MPLTVCMGDYPAFPPATARGRVGCIRVTHPCATLGPRRDLPFDLHVLGLPLAFILSQDQTLHCINVVLFSFSLTLGSRLVLYLTPGHSASLRIMAGFASIAGLKLSKNPQTSSQISVSPPRRLRVQKYYLSAIPQALFLIFLRETIY